MLRNNKLIIRMCWYCVLYDYSYNEKNIVKSQICSVRTESTQV